MSILDTLYKIPITTHMTSCCKTAKSCQFDAILVTFSVEKSVKNIDLLITLAFKDILNFLMES